MTRSRAPLLRRAVLLLLLSTSSTLSTADSMPRTLRDWLQRNTTYRLLSLDDVGDWKPAFQSGRIPFRPFVVADTNADGLLDAVAVLVKAGPPKLYSVVCFQGVRSGFSAEPIWVVENSPEQILGVDVKRNSITPLTCYDCDANAEYTWTGSDYDFFVKGDTVYLSSGAKLFAQPDPNSSIVFAMPQSGEALAAEIIDYGPYLEHRSGDYKRWYKIRISVGPQGPRVGFIKADFYKVTCC